MLHGQRGNLPEAPKVEKQRLGVAAGERGGWEGGRQLVDVGMVQGFIWRFWIVGVFSSKITTGRDMSTCHERPMLDGNLHPQSPKPTTAK